MAYGFITGNIALGLLAMLTAVAVAAVASIGAAQRQRQATGVEDLPHESRALLRPILRLREELREFVGKHSESAALKVIGAEALQEADTIVEHATRLLTLRAQTKKAALGRSLSEQEVAQLEVQLEGATNPAERQALENALAARRAEREHYGPLQDSLRAIDSSLKQAEAALSEMRARLNLAVSDEARFVSGDQQDLNDTVARLRSLSASMDEAEELLRGHLRA